LRFELRRFGQGFCFYIRHKRLLSKLILEEKMSAIDQLLKARESLSSEKQQLEEAIASLDAAIATLCRSEPKEAETAPRPSAPVPAPFSKLARKADREGTQFYKIAQFFLDIENRPTTVA
jgi:hypothetical protein